MKLHSSQKKQIRRFASELEIVYNLFGWKWVGNLETPTAEEIERTIYDLLEGLGEKSYSSSTGGITVMREEGGGIEIRWSLTKSIWI